MPTTDAKRAFAISPNNKPTQCGRLFCSLAIFCCSSLSRLARFQQCATRSACSKTIETRPP
jgi:hypothetical protein